MIAADHTGITVSNLERSLAFWRDVLGLELSHTRIKLASWRKKSPAWPALRSSSRS